MKTTTSDQKTDNVDLSDPILQVDEYSKSQRDVIRVDRECGDEDFEPIKGVKYTMSITEALAIASPGNIIQITEGNYSESLVVQTPNLTIETTDEDAKVIILSGKRPCVTIALDEEDKVEINRIRMVYKGPTATSTFIQKIDMNYEKVGNERCIKEFKLNEGLPSAIMLLSGSLSLNRCVLSLNGVATNMTEKVPCIAAHERTSLSIINCFLFGDPDEEVFTAGLLAIRPFDVIIKDTVVKDHLAGGLMLSLCPYQDSVFQISNNKILKCQTAGIYIEGPGCTPEIIGNEVKYCNSVGIKIGDFVKADIRENQLIQNNDGIEVFNNKSTVIANEIEKSHGHGLLIHATLKEGKFNPTVKGNSISNCKFNGIQIQGDGLRVMIHNNTINNNRKCGIKVLDLAKADIVGKNNIHTNVNQGILIVEGSSCKIMENIISKNLKANIAFGGKGSHETVIERNEICKSIAEGIFMAKAERPTIINENIITENLDGITLLDSDGKIMNNLIEGNQRSGILCSGKTNADISKNNIKSNILIGIMVKKPSNPKMSFNVLKDNHYQFSIDDHVLKKTKTYKNSNTVKGQCDIPKKTCTIF
ncbi:unnamed protein product [Moneuplotes crassus]|uniref:Uncharacterized protein n=1 Tax=Euplotes crassus TaxID=5936 RepID=A0AAD1U5W6_EUPCR|nr:unnamed protein product [Moneuplotes crassus]